MSLTAQLQDTENRDDAFQIIRSMFDEVRLVPKGGKLRIDLRGELAGILSLCRESKNPDHDGQAHAEQILKYIG